VAEGLSTNEIADSLFLSTTTIKTHLAAIQQKFGVENRVLIAVIMTRAQYSIKP